MTSTKARSAGLGAVAFAGFAASLGVAGAAHADAPNTNAPTPDHVCTIDKGSVEYSALDKSGSPTQWHTSSDHTVYKTEPAYGFQVRLTDEAKECSGSINISLASYTTQGPTWETSHLQTFVGYATTTLKKGQDTETLTVKLPGATGPDCFGQLDLYFGTTIYDGGTAKGHGPLPNFDKKVITPTHDELIAGWNGGTVECKPVVTPPSTPPSSSPSTPPSTAPTSTPPSSTPSAPASSAPTTPAPSAPATPPSATTSAPGTPTLAHTGSNAGMVSLVALAFFGAGGTVVMASRKAARKH